MMRKIAPLFIAILALFLLATVATESAAAPASTFPAIISLPDGFRPEGIVTGHGPTLYAGSLADGSIYRIDLRTGEGSLLVEPPEGRVAVGLNFDQRSGLLFAAGGSTGDAYVYDTNTGASVATFALTDPGTFINDVIVTRDAVYFTNSFLPELYRIPLGPGGALPEPGVVETIALGGDFVQGPGFNANGIGATPNGKWLILVQSSPGRLYRVDPQSGDAQLIDLGGNTVPNGDGILLAGHTLYVVQNQLNQVAVVQLDAHYASSEIVDTLTDSNFDIPTTIAAFGDRLYAVNARFTTPPTPDTEYHVVQFSSH